MHFSITKITRSEIRSNSKNEPKLNYIKNPIRIQVRF